MIDRMELLKLALAKEPDARKAIGLAREMETFLTGTPAHHAQPLEFKDEGLSPPDWLEKPLPPKPPPGTMTMASAEPKLPVRHQKHWRQDEANRAAALYDQGVSRKEIARLVGRGKSAIDQALQRGIIPATTYQKNELASLAAQLSHINRPDRTKI